MYQIVGNRACSILYNWLVTNQICGTVLLAANICETVPSAYLKAGIDLEFCDINRSTLTPDFDSILLKLKNNKNISVLHYNHTYGMLDSIELDFLAKVKNNFPKLIIVEDRCLSIPDLKIPSSHSDLILYSTGHTKVVNVQFGGYAYSRKKYKYSEIESLYDKKDEDNLLAHIKECHAINRAVNVSVCVSNWINTKAKFSETMYIDDVAEKLEISMKHKRHINEIYEDRLSFCSLDSTFQNWRYNILVENQNMCLDVLFKNGLYASKHYKSLGSDYFVSEVFRECDWLENHVINLFNDFCYTEEQALKTADLLSDLARKVGD